MPYSLARPILLNIHNPEKLVRLSKLHFLSLHLDYILSVRLIY